MYSMGGEMLVHKEGEFYSVSDVDSIIEENEILKDQIQLLKKVSNELYNSNKELAKPVNPGYQRGERVKIIATVKGCVQVGMDQWENRSKSFIFDSTDTIDKMLEVTKVKTFDEMNLSEVTETVIYSRNENPGINPGY